MRVEGADGLRLRYRLVAGSTVRWAIRMDLDLRVEADGVPDQTIDAMVTSRVDCEVLRTEGHAAIVRPFAHASDFWVRGGTLTEDDVADPMSGFVKAFLLDDLGGVIPLADERGAGPASPQDGSAGRALLLALFPPFVHDVIEPGATWSVHLHTDTVAADGPVAVHASLKGVDQAINGALQPVVLHGVEYSWRRPFDPARPSLLGVDGTLRLAAENYVGRHDGWVERGEAKAEMTVAVLGPEGVVQTVHTQLKIVTERE